MLSKKALAAKQVRDLEKTLALKKIYSNTQSLRTFIVPSSAQAEQFLVAQQEKSKNIKAKISITYRNDGLGKGAAFDHHTMQQISGVETIIAHAETKSTRDFVEYTRSTMHSLKFGEPTEESMGRNIPPKITEAKDCDGLLFIPGASRATIENRTSEYGQRIEYDTLLLNKAKLTGQPVLGICGGAWEIWQYLGGSIRDVKGHSYRAGMPRMKNNGKIGNNKQIHRITLQENGSILRGAMQKNSESLPATLTVNSVHWQACDETTIPDFLDISATALHDDEIAPKNVQTENNTIEAAENKSGAPMLLIQWHPEAYFQNTDAIYYPQLHQNIIHYMAKAGHAYILRNQMVNELKMHTNADDDTVFQSFRQEILKSTGAVKQYGRLLFRANRDTKFYYTTFSTGLDPSLKHFHEHISERQAKITFLEERWEIQLTEAKTREQRKKFHRKRKRSDDDKENANTPKKSRVKKEKVFLDPKRSLIKPFITLKPKTENAPTVSQENLSGMNYINTPHKNDIKKERLLQKSRQMLIRPFFTVKPKAETSPAVLQEKLCGNSQTSSYVLLKSLPR